MNNLEQNSLFASSVTSPKSVGLMSMDNNNLMTMQSGLYSPSAYYQQQRTSSPGYRSFDSNQSQPSYHDPHTGVKTPIFDEFLTPPPSYVSGNHSTLSIHSHMNVSFQETSANPSTMTPSSSFNHHSTTYPY